MGTYYIPRNLRGETRILVIFTVKSLISTAAGAVLGSIFYFMLNILGFKTAGIIILAVMALLGFAIGAIKIPFIPGIPFTRNIAGDPLSEIIFRYFKFKTNRKIYTYTKEEK